MTREPRSIAVLGGGPAGLAVGYFAKKHALPFTIYEASGQVGGNCRTLHHGPFRFDTGAHRFHDKDPVVTAELQQLMGAELRRVEVPSQIHHEGRNVDFPLSPLNLLRTLGVARFSRAAASLVRARLGATRAVQNFEDMAVRKYGREVAASFLLNYTEKLWDIPCSKLAADISGSRMKGLGLRTFLIEGLLGERSKTKHLDGAFYYPVGGFGRIAEMLETACDPRNVRVNARITAVHHDGERVRSIEVNDGDRVETNDVVSTLPLSLLIRILDPSPPDDIIALADRIRFRSLLVVALFLKRKSVTSNGTVYFPDPEVPFTRVCEPRNRSESMAPPGCTSLVAEIPCRWNDDRWTLGDRALAELVGGHLTRLGLIAHEEISDSAVHRIRFAYPILEIGYEKIVEGLLQYLERFENLKVVGRNGRFVYGSLHHMIRFGMDAADALAAHRSR